jgi:predicted MFS family arabinose efflux permease
MLAIPAAINLALLGTARLIYPRPEDMETEAPDLTDGRLPRVYWIYLAGAALVAAGFPDFSMMSYHFSKMQILAPTWIPIFYAVSMGFSGTGSLLFGRMFDKKGLGILIPLTAVTCLFSPLAFFGGFWAVLIACALWGAGMGVHESIVAAAVSTIVPPHRRASAYGIFSATYGISWFLGSALIGFLYDHSLNAVVAFSVAAELAAIPFFFVAARNIHKNKAKESKT